METEIISTNKKKSGPVRRNERMLVSQNSYTIVKKCLLIIIDTLHVALKRIHGDLCLLQDRTSLVGTAMATSGYSK
jgi:hypothetical protein